jgi:hypothetical protein
MPQFPIPTQDELYEYLLLVYFGSHADRLSRCISRAYRDMNRTMREFRKFRTAKEREDLHARASGVVRSFLVSLAATQGVKADQASFDVRHQTTCVELRSTYAGVGFGKFQIGQAQKWLNMTLKYVFAFGEDRLPGYSEVFHLAHIPLDSIILKRLRPLGAPGLSGPWSAITEHEEYMGIQRWVRSSFPDSAPLAVEFALWQGSVALVPTDITLA